MSAEWSFETRQIHAGQTPDGEQHARALPIYQGYRLPSVRSGPGRGRRDRQ